MLAVAFAVLAFWIFPIFSGDQVGVLIHRVVSRAPGRAIPTMHPFVSEIADITIDTLSSLEVDQGEKDE